MNLRRTLLLAAVIGGSNLAAGRADAQCGYGGGYGYWDIGRLYSVLADRVPYYAAFPPVYYSHPVARTYGYSPFAYPPGVMTPEIETAVPLSIVNPHFKGGAETGTAEADAAGSGDVVDQTTGVNRAAEPLVILNPYVVPAAALAGR